MAHGLGRIVVSNFVVTLVLVASQAGGQSAYPQTSFTGQGLVYSAHAGGRAVAVDDTGSAYVVESAPAPNVAGTIPPGLWVTKLAADGGGVLYRHYIGHGNGTSIAVDAAHNAYIAGYGPRDASFLPTETYLAPGSGALAFVVKLDPDGHLTYATTIGGSDAVAHWRLAVDPAGNAYVTGESAADFPTTPGAYDRDFNGAPNPIGDAVVFKLSATGTLVYSTYLGGNEYDEPRGIVVDAAGSAYVAGVTRSTDFPTTPGVFQPVRGSGADAFVAKLNPAGSALVFSTYLGGFESDVAEGIALDASSNVYVGGETASTNFPATPGAARTRYIGNAFDLFVVKLNATATALVYGTYLGGADNDQASGIAVDTEGHAFVTGDTVSRGFPVVPYAFQKPWQGSDDSFVTKLDDAGAISYSTYLGGTGPDAATGIAVDANGDVYVTGLGSGDFPITADTATTVPIESRTPFTLKLIPRATLVRGAVSSSDEAQWLSAPSAIDGSPLTRWSSQFSDPQWLAVDLGQRSTVDRVVMTWETAYGRAYELQVSDDGANWTSVYGTDSGDGGVDDIRNLAASGRYVRVLGLSRGTEWGYSLWEFAVFGTPIEGANVAPTVKIVSPGPGATFYTGTTFEISVNVSDPDGTVVRVDYYVNDVLVAQTTAPHILNYTATQPGGYTIRAVAYDDLAASSSSTVGIMVLTEWQPGDNLALGKPTFSSSDESPSLTPGYAVDGSGSTRWSSGFSDPQWMYVDLGRRFTISGVILRWETAYASSFQIDVSDDARTWTTAYSTDAGSGGVQTLAGLSAAGRYVRMYGRARATPWGYSLWEFEVYGTPIDGDGTSNIAAGKPAVSSSSESAALGPEFVNDGSMSTRWSSRFADNQWIYVDLGALYDLKRVVLRWETAYASHYLLQVSNDATIWRTVRDVYSGGTVDDFADLSSAARFVRMFGLTRATPWGFSLWELEAYGTPAALSPNLSTAAIATASSVENDTLGPTQAIDGRADTRWSSAFRDGESLTLDFRAPVTLKRLALRWETAYARAYTIQASPDGANWRDVLSIADGDGDVDDLPIDSRERYIRIVCNERATPWGCSLWEVEAYGAQGTLTGVARWKVLVLVYEATDFTYADANGTHHVTGTIPATQLAEVDAAATRFVNTDIPALTSGHMVPYLTIRHAGTLSSLATFGSEWWPSPWEADINPQRDPAFDSVIVVWQPYVTDTVTGEGRYLSSWAGLTPSMGVGQTYLTLIANAATSYGHLNVFKHEYGHSLLSYFDAAGTAPKPAVENHTVAGTYVHCGTGEPYVWVDETDLNPVPNSIYNDQSGFTHDYYSGTTALASAPAQCLGITPAAWAAGGPVSRP